MHGAPTLRKATRGPQSQSVTRGPQPMASGGVGSLTAHALNIFATRSRRSAVVSGTHLSLGTRFSRAQGSSVPNVGFVLVVPQGGVTKKV